MRIGRLLPALALALAGCRPAAPPASNAPAPAPPAGALLPQMPVGGPVSPRGAGPLSLGMSEASARLLPGLAAGEPSSPAKGVTRLPFRAGRALTPAVVADLREGKVVRLLVRDPAFVTMDGFKVGDAAGKLHDRYGRPTLVRREGALCAEFAKAPGLAFCFAPGSAPAKDWPGVLKAGLSVVAIDVRGQPGAK